MGIFKDSGRKDTGRTDKYSDESPRKDYSDYRKDVSPDKVERAIKKKDPTMFVGKRSLDVKKQELISHIQNFKETFNSAELNMWENRLNVLRQALLDND